MEEVFLSNHSDSNVAAPVPDGQLDEGTGAATLESE